MALYDFSRLSAGGRTLTEPFPDPFADYASLVMPSSINSALLWCFVPGTPIEMADFSIKSIEDVDVGDRVLTRGGTHERVVAKSTRHFDGQLRVVEFAGLGRHLPWKVTPSHKVYRIAGDGKQHSRTKTRIELSQVEQVTAADLRPGDYIATPLPVAPKATTPRFSGWLLGMYLSEGCPVDNGVGARGIRFTLGAADEELGIAQRLVDELKRQTGIEVAIYTPPSRPDVRLVTIFDVEFTDWCTQHGSTYAKNKSLSEEVLAYGSDFLRDLLAGFADGDGWIREQRGGFFGLGLTTTSRSLAYQLLRVGQFIGIRISLAKVKSDRGFAAEGSIAYQLAVVLEDSPQFADRSVKLRRSLLDLQPRGATKSSLVIRDGYVFRRVNQVSEEAYSGPVCNFEVENDHSYIANGVLTGNCEYIASANGVYAAAIQRVIGFFITDIEITGTSEKEKERYKDFLCDTLGIQSILRSVAYDFLVYGNSFSSLIVPFRRYLSCAGCGFEAPLKVVHQNPRFKFRWQQHKFYAHCPLCGHQGEWAHNDRRSGDEQQIRVKRWNPKEFELKWDQYSDAIEYVWRIPGQYRADITRGELVHLDRVPWEVVKAVQENANLEFDNDVIYHMKEPALAGIWNRGWGLSRILTNFRQAWYLQVLHRFNEAIGMDYIMPLRVIMPDLRAGQPDSADAGWGMDMADFSSSVEGMLLNRRRDPTSWHVSSYPLRYQILGGEASNLAPSQLIDQAHDILLNAIGVPVELYKANLSIQAAPTAVRFMESNWSHLTHALNRFLTWLVDRVSEVMAWDKVKVKLARPGHYDDLNRQLARLQLVTSGLISQTTGLESIGVNFEEEQRRMRKEQQFLTDQSAEVQEEAEASQLAKDLPAAMSQQAGPPAGQPGMPPPAGATAGGVGMPMQGDPVEALLGMLPQQNEPITPPEMYQLADSVANQAYGLSSTQRISLLRKLKPRNEAIWSLVKSRLEAIDNQNAQQGVQQGRQAAQAASQQQPAGNSMMMM